jgi:hypothetical protein
MAVATWSVDPASAATRSVPPGVSGATQYTETLPGPGGEESTHQIGAEGRHPGASAKDKLGEQNAGRLEELGPEGKAAANLAAAGVTGSGDGPSAGRRGVGSGGEKGATDAGTGASEPSGSSPVGQLLGEVTGTSGSQGMGALLPLLIAAAALVAVGFLVGRRRTIRAHD